MPNKGIYSFNPKLFFGAVVLAVCITPLIISLQKDNNELDANGAAAVSIANAQWQPSLAMADRLDFRTRQWHAMGVSCDLSPGRSTEQVLLMIDMMDLNLKMDRKIFKFCVDQKAKTLRPMDLASETITEQTAPVAAPTPVANFANNTPQPAIQPTPNGADATASSKGANIASELSNFKGKSSIADQAIHFVKTEYQNKYGTDAQSEKYAWSGTIIRKTQQSDLVTVHYFISRADPICTWNVLIPRRAADQRLSVSSMNDCARDEFEPMKNSEQPGR